MLRSIGIFEVIFILVLIAIVGLIIWLVRKMK
jgi:hypothetical protein